MCRSRCGPRHGLAELVLEPRATMAFVDGERVSAPGVAPEVAREIAIEVDRTRGPLSPYRRTMTEATTVSIAPRIDFEKLAPAPSRAVSQLDHAVTKQLDAAGIDHRLRELVRIRASQLNGCAYCIDMHTKDARAVGETEQRLYALPVWRETPFFSDRERAALHFTESVTRMTETHVPNADYDAVAAEFSPRRSALLSLILVINAWNTLGVATRAWEPGSYSPDQPTGRSSSLTPMSPSGARAACSVSGSTTPPPTAGIGETPTASCRIGCAHPHVQRLPRRGIAAHVRHVADDRDVVDVSLANHDSRSVPEAAGQLLVDQVVGGTRGDPGRSSCAGVPGWNVRHRARQRGARPRSGIRREPRASIASARRMDHASSAGIPIVVVRHVGEPGGGTFEPGTPAQELRPRSRPARVTT